MTDPFWGYWYYHLPNYLLSLVIWTLFGRLLLGFFVPPDWRNYIWRGFRFVTDPFLRAAAAITPRYVLPLFMPLVAVFWLVVIRYIFFVVMAANGLTPPIEAGP